MKHQWKELEEEKEKAGKTANKELEKIEKDIEELKQKEDMRVSG
jgi:ADP-dependent phosphofructokinase/glucokinase